MNEFNQILFEGIKRRERFESDDALLTHLMREHMRNLENNEFEDVMDVFNQILFEGIKRRERFESDDALLTHLMREHMRNLENNEFEDVMDVIYQAHVTQGATNVCSSEVDNNGYIIPPMREQ